MLAFNKSIAEELKARGVNARTFHSLCYTPVTRAKGTSTVEVNKLRMLCDANLVPNDKFIYGAFIQRVVGLARQSGVGCLIPDVEAIWYDIIEHHDLELENEKADYTRAVELARQLLVWSNESKMVDFDDLLYFAVKDGISLPKYDFVFVDEGQDTNAIQRAILKKMLNPKSRLIVVGDPAQAIYGFRGADSESLNLIAKEFGASKLPLTVSYRCATNVVKYAQQWVSHIEAAPNAPAGEVVNLGATWEPEVFGKTDLVVCRTTKPLITLAYKMLRKHLPVTIMGREIGQGLISLVKKMNANDLDEMTLKVEAWAQREVDKAMVKNLDSKVEAIQDKADAIICLADSLPEDRRTIAELISVIDNLFANKAGSVRLATIHKSKGMEADKVYWLNSSKCPAKWARKDWQRSQEINLCYVAATRAKTSLVLIEESA